MGLENVTTCTILMAIFISPLAVGFEKGVSTALLFNIVLFCCFPILGMIHYFHI